MLASTPEVSIPDALAALRDVAPAGYAIALHVRFSTPAYLFQTYPAAWIEEYSREGLVMRDPTVRWGLETMGRITWAELAPADEAGVLARAARHGLRHGVTIGLERGGSRSLASFARGDRPFLEPEVQEIEAVLVGLHDRTAEALPLPRALRDELRRLSVAFTHP